MMQGDLQERWLDRDPETDSNNSGLNLGLKPSQDLQICVRCADDPGIADLVELDRERLSLGSRKRHLCDRNQVIGINVSNSIGGMLHRDTPLE